MKSKEVLLKQFGVSTGYNPHGGILPDRKEVSLFEVLIDIRDSLLSGDKALLLSLNKLQRGVKKTRKGI